MAAPADHQKSGKCTQCGKVFTPQSMVLSIRYRDPDVPNHILRRPVCGACHREFYSRGE